MYKIGFDPNGQQENSAEQTGAIDDYPENSQPMWVDLLESFTNSLFHFAMIYGFYASIRDLITSMF